MAGHLILAALVLHGINAYLMLRWANMGYPPARKWRLTFFLLSFAFGVLLASGIAYGSDSLGLPWSFLFIVGIGLFTGLGFAFLFPSNLQHVIPKPGSKRALRLSQQRSKALAATAPKQPVINKPPYPH